MRWVWHAGITVALGLTVIGANPAAGGAANECHEIKACVAVEGPWVAVHHGFESHFLLSCPKHGIVGGIDAIATTADVALSFDGQLGSPISPGITTSTSAYFRGVLARGRIAAFQPWLGCIEVGGGGRSTVSARVAPGADIKRRTRVLWLKGGETRTAYLGCQAGERYVGGWHAIAFYTPRPPNQHELSLVHATQALAGRGITVTAAASESLPNDAHALVQLGAACAT